MVAGTAENTHCDPHGGDGESHTRSDTCFSKLKACLQQQTFSKVITPGQSQPVPLSGNQVLKQMGLYGAFSFKRPHSAPGPLYFATS